MTNELATKAELSRILGVDKSAIGHALKTGHKVKGIDLATISRRNPDGSLAGFDVSNIHYLRSQPALPVRSNPAPETSELGQYLTPGNVIAVGAGIRSLEPQIQHPIWVLLAGIGVGYLGYKASDSHRGAYALGGFVLGSLTFLGAQHMNAQAKLKEDRATLGSDPSAFNTAGGKGGGESSTPPITFAPLRAVVQS